MTRAFQALANAACVLVVACAVTTSTPPSSPVGTRSSAAPEATSELLTGARVLIKDWLYISNVGVSPRWIVWSGVESGDATRSAQQLMLLDRSTSSVRAIASAPDPAGLIAWLRVNDDWAAWVDYTDRSRITDWRLQAMRLPDGKPVTLLRAPADAQLEDRPEFDLSGSEILVSARPEGAVRMELRRISLSNAVGETLLSARPGETFGWPALDGDRGVAETHSAGGDGLVVFSSISSRKWTMLTGGARSEPVLASHWLAYKSAARGADGPLILRDLDSSVERVLADSVEAPVANGSRFAWSTGIVRDLQIADAASGRRFLVPVKDVSRSFYALDRVTLVYIAASFEGTARYQIHILDVPG